MTFPIPRPKAQPGPAKAPIRYVRCAEFESGTQAIFGRPRIPEFTSRTQSRAVLRLTGAGRFSGGCDEVPALASCIRLHSIARLDDAYDQAGTKNEK